MNFREECKYVGAKFRKAESQNEPQLGTEKETETALEEEEDGEGKGCATAQWGEKAFSHTSEIKQSAKRFSVLAFTKRDVMYFDFSKAAAVC